MLRLVISDTLKLTNYYKTLILATPSALAIIQYGSFQLYTSR